MRYIIIQRDIQLGDYYVAEAPKHFPDPNGFCATTTTDRRESALIVTEAEADRIVAELDALRIGSPGRPGHAFKELVSYLKEAA